ncbi:5-dehydro-2-deoxygluconokinase [Vibrio thalassae]|uniref:5-dehydro-2-deoxygluconokinase n=1 Tax=Vibrio thalassae TaxID=1243014 RepID=A0A240ELI6_9VIBR|nr:5-dehydro-2-deoxygluconokinase [Vibrio thalassae]SNX49494.1 5-dehydro-2-deoxygluconokinase [Vibrio thalassae]
MKTLDVVSDRYMDAIVLGRAGVDLYSAESGTSMDKVAGFRKFVGGSAANIAIAMSKLGKNVGMISCVSDDPFGKYVLAYLGSNGIDLRGISLDDTGSRTSVAFTEMKPGDCSVLIYRNDASDLTIKPEDIDVDYIANSKVLVVTGTALSKSPSREAALLAMQYARQHNTLVVLDLDYRPYSWRHKADAALYYQLAVGLSDIIIGNREEFNVMESLMRSDNKDDDVTAKLVLQHQHVQIVVVKAGELGCKVYCRDGTRFEQGIFRVKVNKPFGAGDAFAGALLSHLIAGGALEEGVRLGSGAAAINVASDNCTEAMPTLDELTSFISCNEQS